MKRKSKYEKYFIRRLEDDLVLGLRRNLEAGTVLVGGSRKFMDHLESIMEMFGWTGVEWKRDGWRVRSEEIPVSETGWQEGMRELRKSYELETTNSFRRLLR